MNLGHIQIELHKAQAAKRGSTCTNGHLPVDSYIKDVIGAYVRSGALDAKETLTEAVKTSALLFRMTEERAWGLWIAYVALVLAANT